MSDTRRKVTTQDVEEYRLQEELEEAWFELTDAHLSIEGLSPNDKVSYFHWELHTKALANYQHVIEEIHKLHPQELEF